MFDERTDTVVQCRQLMKGDLSLTPNALSRCLGIEATARGNGKPDQLKRVWSGAKVELKPEMTAIMRTSYVGWAFERRGIRITGASKRGWTASATHALAQINSTTPSMINALTELGNRSATDVANGL